MSESAVALETPVMYNIRRTFPSAGGTKHRVVEIRVESMRGTSLPIDPSLCGVVNLHHMTVQPIGHNTLETSVRWDGDVMRPTLHLDMVPEEPFSLLLEVKGR